MCRLLVCAVVALSSARYAGAQDRFALEAVLSSPFPSNLVAASRHGKLAWTENAEGRRSIWVATAPGYEGRAIVRINEDNGQEITDLHFGPGANHLLYVRGGLPNRSGEFPNPTSDPEGAEQAIWVVAADGSGEPRRLAEGGSPAISPDGKSAAFIRKGQLAIIPILAEGESKELAKTRGRAGSLKWSPDGRKLAFVSNRGDHGFIGVYSFDTETVRYLDPSLARDSSPVWSPDGKHVAFIRIPNERQLLPFIPRREAQPWSIRLADVATGAGRLVFSADEGRGSAFRGIESPDQLFWARGDRLVFPWEKDGWTHLYSVPLSGGLATLLTPGSFEVEHAFLAPDGGEVIYSSNQDDIDRRHIWRAPVQGGAPRAVTSGRGIEWDPVMTGDGDAIAFLASDARKPAHAQVMVGTSPPRPLSPNAVPSDFPAESLVEPEQVVFSAADGIKIHGQLFLPMSHRPGERHPGVLFFHGGSRRQMLLGWHYRSYYHNAYALNQYLASRGYVVLSVNYRSGIGYGMEFREALDYGARGASEFNDVVGAGLYLRSRDDVDPDRIGLWGGSYGGYLTALGLARASDLFAAGVDLHGVHDWNVVIRNFVPDYVAEKRAEVARLAYESSPMASISSWRSPVLLIHGDDDRNVPFSESVDLAEALAKQGVDYEELVFPDEVHGFLLHRNWLAAYRAAIDFFDRKLMKTGAQTSEP